MALHVIQPQQGGLGTEIAPSVGQIPIGQSDGTYLPSTPSGSLTLDRLTSITSSAGKTLIFTHDGTNATLTNSLGYLKFLTSGQTNEMVWDPSKFQLKIGEAGFDTVNNWGVDIWKPSLIGLRVYNSAAPGSGGGAGITMDSAVPTASGHRLGRFSMGGYNGVGTRASGSTVESFSTEAWTVGASQGTDIRFYVTPTGTASRKGFIFTHDSTDGLLTLDTGALALGQALRLNPKGTATSGTTEYNSYELYFRGSAWDANSSYFLPTFTTYTNGSYTISASSETASFEAWRARGTGDWFSNGVETTSWWKIDLGSAYAITKYKVTSNSIDVSYSQITFQLQGSNTGAFSGEEATLDTRVNVFASTLELKEYTIANTTAYRYYRIYCTSFSAGYASFSDINLYGYPSGSPDAAVNLSSYFQLITSGGVSQSSTLRLYGPTGNPVVDFADSANLFNFAVYNLSGEKYARFLRTQNTFQLYGDGVNRIFEIYDDLTTPSLKFYIDSTGAPVFTTMVTFSGGADFTSGSVTFGTVGGSAPVPAFNAGFSVGNDVVAQHFDTNKGDFYINANAGATAASELSFEIRNSLAVATMITDAAGRLSFGYGGPQLNVVSSVILGFLQATGNYYSTSAVNYKGVLSYINHTSSVVTPGNVGGLIGVAGVNTSTSTTIPTSTVISFGVMGVSGNAADSTSFTGKYIGALYAKIGTLAGGSDVYLGTANLDAQSNYKSSYGNTAHVTGLLVDFSAFHFVKGGLANPTNRPVIASGARIPIMGLASSEQWGIYGDNPAFSTASLNAVTTTGFMRIPFPVNTSATNSTHLYFEPKAASAGGPTWAVDGGVYFDSGASNEKGLYEKRSGQWDKLLSGDPVFYDNEIVAWEDSMVFV